MGMGRRDDSEPKTFGEELAELRVEVKWTKWLAAGALGASTLGQVTNFAPPTALFDLLFGRLL